jgi:DNA-directed RNA polymerase specialized sigma subunit
MMRLYYIKHKTFNQIADELGYSEVGIARMHQRIIKKIRRLYGSIAGMLAAMDMVLVMVTSN